MRRLALCILIAMGAASAGYGQILKKAKDRLSRAAENSVIRKVEQKTDEVVDKAIDAIFEGSEGNKKNERSDSKNKDYGDAQITGPNHPSVLISEVAQPKVKIDEAAGETVISAWWVTHGKDSYDMFLITIPQILEPGADVSQSFSLPTEAQLKIYYDAFLGAYKDADQRIAEDPNFELVHNEPFIEGSLSLTELSEERIVFSFSGSGYEGKVEVEKPLITRVDKNKLAEKDDNSNRREETTPLEEAKGGIYHFTTEIKTLVTTEEKEEYEVSYLINPDASYFGMKADMSDYDDGQIQGNSVIITDGEEVRIFVDSDVMKMQMNTKTPKQDYSADLEVEKFDPPSKTGRKKKVLGYTCYEYTASHEEGEITYWATTELDLPNWLFGGEAAAEYMGVSGFVLEFASKSKDGNVSSKVISIDESTDFSIDASEYKNFNFGN